MTPDTVEQDARTSSPSVVDRPLRPSVRRPLGALRPDSAPGPRAGQRSGQDRLIAWRVTWRALWSSRLLVWAAGTGTVLLFGPGPHRGAFNPPGITRGLGWLGNLLAAPAARWDAAWYLVIAHYGYRPELGVFTAPRTAFFPLYPLGLRGVSWFGVPPVLAGVLLSLLAFAAGLYGIHRLTTLELGRNALEPARLAVLLCAFAPMAFFFSAVYSESLYMALSVGVFWCARQGRWALVGVLGALAAATRSTGLVLMLPAAMIYLYGPREDRLADFPAGARAWLGRRYRLRRDVGWLLAIPAGMGLFMLALAYGGGDGLAPLHAQGLWGRQFAGPYAGVWDGLKAAFDGARQLLSFQRRHLYYPSASGSPLVAAGHNLTLLAFLLAAVPALVLALRRLPLAYGVYAIAALALPLSYPVAAQPLMSLPRFLVVLFPLTIASASWLSEHPRVRLPLLIASAALLVLFAGQFSTWHWVA